MVLVPRVFILLSCIGQRSLSNSGVLEGLLNLLDNLLSPLQQPQASAHCRTEGISGVGRKVNRITFCEGETICSMCWMSFEMFCLCVPGVLDIPMISWVVMLVSRLLDYVASVEDEASGAKKHLGGKERERPLSGEPEAKFPSLWQFHLSAKPCCFYRPLVVN